MNQGWASHLRLPDDMPRDMMIKRWFAKSYGWTPGQVADLTLEELFWYPIIEDAANVAEERQHQQEMAHQKRGMR